MGEAGRLELTEKGDGCKLWCLHAFVCVHMCAHKHVCMHTHTLNFAYKKYPVTCFGVL